MKKSVELLRAKNALKEEIETLKNDGKIAEAHAKLNDLEVLNKDLEITLTLEAEETNVVKNTGTEQTGTSAKDVNPIVVFNKQVLGKPLTKAEQLYVENAIGSPGQVEGVDERGGYLVPEEQAKQIKEFRRTRVALKNYCTVIPVTTISGKFPMGTDQDGKLINFEELTEINQSDVRFTQQNWTVTDYGDIIPISNQLLQDSAVNLITYIGDQFVRKAINTENDKILTVLKAAIKVTGKDYNDITTVLNKTLDPAISATSIIVTNQDGFDYLDKLTDATGKPMLSDSLTKPMTKVFKGREIVVLTDNLLPSTTGSAPKMPFFVGDLKQAVNFYDRLGVEVAISDVAGFTKYATLLRAVERFDVKAYDVDAVRFVEIPVAAEQPAG